MHLSVLFGTVLSLVLINARPFNLWSLTNQITPQELNELIQAAQAAGINNIESIANLTPTQEDAFINNAKAMGVSSNIIDGISSALSSTGTGTADSASTTTSGSATSTTSPTTTSTADEPMTDKQKNNIIIGCSVAGGFLLIMLLLWLWSRYKSKQQNGDKQKLHEGEMQGRDHDMNGVPIAAAAMPAMTRHSRTSSNDSKRSLTSLDRLHSNSPIPECDPKLVTESDTMSTPTRAAKPAHSFLSRLSGRQSEVSSDPRHSVASSSWRSSGYDDKRNSLAGPSHMRDSMISVNSDYSTGTVKPSRSDSVNNLMTPSGTRWSTNSETWSLESSDEKPKSGRIQDSKPGYRAQ